MNLPGAGPQQGDVAVRRFLPPGAVWAAALFAAPFLNEDGLSALVWGTGAALLIALFPWALVTVLDRRGDLRRGINRLGASPVILGALGAAFMVLRLIRWTDGPKALAAVVFGMIAAYALTTVVSAGRHNKVSRLDWAAVTYAAAAVVLPVLLYLLFPGVLGAAAAITAVVLCAGFLISGSSRRAAGETAAAAAVGVLAGGGVFLWLLAYSL